MFKNKNFISLFLGRIFTNIGDSIFYILSMWLVFEVTKSSIYVGIAGFMFTLPSILNIFLGPIIDNNNPKRLYIFASLMQALLILVLLAMLFTDSFSISIFLLIIFTTTVFSEITYPLENVIIPRVVPKRELIKANSIMSIAYQGLDLLFSGIAGVLISLFTITLLYGINLIAFAIPIICILFLKIAYKKKDKSSVKDEWLQYKKDFVGGLHFIKLPLIFDLLLPLVLINFLFSIILVSLPSFAASLGGSSTYGLIIASLGVGSVIGAFFIEKVQEIFPLGKVMSGGFFASGVAWIVMVFSSQENITLMYFLLILSYTFIGAINVLFTTLFQSLPSENMLGRVNTAVESFVSISMPIGSLVGGILATYLPTSYVISAFGIGLILLSLYYSINARIQRLPKVTELINDDYLINQ